MHMCVCVCVCVIFLHHSVILFYSSILLLWCIGYDDFISMSNVIVFVLIIIILLLVLLLANMKMNILEKSLFSISHGLLYFSLFLHFIYFCISSIYIFLINFCFSFFLSSGVFILSPTLVLFFVSFLPSLSLLVFLFVILSFSFSFSFSLYHCQSLYDITRFYMMYCIIWYCMWLYDIMH